jgi:TIR domain/Sel1 repeat
MFVPAHEPAAFISYSRDDSEFALRLAQDLKAAGASVWLDQLDIPPGRPWDNAIEDALSDAPQMLIVLSPSSARSDNVRNEISFALEQGKIIIPVLYMDCVVPLRLQRTQRIDFRADYARGLTALLAHLQVMRPDPLVLQKAAEGDALRRAAWQAREAEAKRLREMEDRRERDAEREVRVQRDRQGEAAVVREEQRKVEREAVERRENQFRIPSQPPFQSGEGDTSQQPLQSSWQRISRRAPLILSAIIVMLVVVLVYVLRLHPSQPLQSNPSARTQQPVAVGGFSGNGQQASPSAPTAATNPVPPKQKVAAAERPAAASSAKPLLLPKQDTARGRQIVVVSPLPDAMQLDKQACNSGEANSCERTCNLGEANGCSRLGYLYEFGNGASKNLQKAAVFYQKGCDGGDPWGCRDVALLYLAGNGISQNIDKAKQLYKKGCSLGDQPSCDALKNAKFQ